ncbi:hypothetical protein ACFRQM_37510, partial [Streptomyces sp. NPDC056831]|uniref:hypothetical protein n=1 Tax=Streptomyces sp. NPDC056831 TaxID=3345954 RepID=UPI00369862B9
MGFYVELFEFVRTLASAELDALAAALVDHAAQLRALARHLGTLRAAEGTREVDRRGRRSHG